MHRHRPAPAIDPTYNPCAEYYITADDCSRLPRQLAGHRTPANFWRAVVAMARMSQDGVPCYQGLRGLARAAGLSPETLVKYRQLAVTLGLIRQIDRAGAGSGRLTTLSVPVRSPYWGSFSRRAESENRSHLSDPVGVKIVNSELISEIEPPATTDDVPADPPASTGRSVDADVAPISEKSIPADAPTWPVTALIAAIWAICGWNIAPLQAMAILRTCRRRRLTLHSPEDIMRAVMADRTAEWGAIALHKIASPGGFVHASCQRLRSAQIPALTTAYANSNAVNCTNSGKRTEPYTGPTYDEIKRRYEQAPRVVVTPPPADSSPPLQNRIHAENCSVRSNADGERETPNPTRDALCSRFEDAQAWEVFYFTSGRSRADWTALVALYDTEEFEPVRDEFIVWVSQHDRKRRLRVEGSAEFRSWKFGRAS